MVRLGRVSRFLIGSEKDPGIRTDCDRLVRRQFSVWKTRKIVVRKIRTEIFPARDENIFWRIGKTELFDVRLMGRKKKNILRETKIRKHPILDRPFQFPVNRDPAFLKPPKLSGKERKSSGPAEIWLKNIARQEHKIYILRDRKVKDPFRTLPGSLKALLTHRRRQFRKPSAEKPAVWRLKQEFFLRNSCV